MTALSCRYKDAGGVALLRASLLARDGKLKDAEAAIASVTADKAEDLHTELQLMRAQLAVEASNHSQVWASTSHGSYASRGLTDLHMSRVASTGILHLRRATYPSSKSLTWMQST